MNDILATIPKAYDGRCNEYDLVQASPEPIREALLALIGHELSGQILEAGSGRGEWIKSLKQLKDIKRIVSVDIVDPGVSKMPGVEFYLCDLSYDPLPFETGELDWIFAIELLEHLANPRHIIMEASRCLRKGGRLVVTTPCNDALTSRLSFLFRGYFPGFCDQVYKYSGHITPLSELDVTRMSTEAKFSRVNFHYPIPGRIPKTNIPWQKFFPFLHGKLWSDNLIAILTK